MKQVIGRMFEPPEVLRKRVTLEDMAARNGVRLENVLNVGSKNVRIGRDCLNVDLMPGMEVDIVGDAHELVDLVGERRFDVVVLCAVLQYCRDPAGVVAQASRVLRPGGWIFIDAPFLQPYCIDGADLWRFSADGLRQLCEPHFAILELEPCIGSGPAIASAAVAAARARGNRYAAAVLGWATSLSLWPLRYVPHADPRTAGAFLLLGRKRPDGASETIN